MAQHERKQSTTSYPLCFPMYLLTGGLATGKTVAVTLSKNGGAFAAAAGAVSEIGNGWYALAGNATDRNTVGELAVHATNADCNPTDFAAHITSHDPFDLADEANVYWAKVIGPGDDDLEKDRWVVQWFKNSAAQTSGITSPVLTVKQVGSTDTLSTLISNVAMTDLGSGILLYTATGSERFTPGRPLIVTVSATIDSASRSWTEVLTRDNP